MLVNDCVCRQLLPKRIALRSWRWHCKRIAKRILHLCLLSFLFLVHFQKHALFTELDLIFIPVQIPHYFSRLIVEVIVKEIVLVVPVICLLIQKQLHDCLRLSLALIYFARLQIGHIGPDKRQKTGYEEDKFEFFVCENPIPIFNNFQLF